MKFRHQVHYDAGAAEVHAMLTDPAFRKRAAEHVGALSVDVAVTPGAAGATTVHVERVEDLAGVPDFVKRVFGATVTVVQQEEWSSPTRAGFRIESRGKPVSFVGELILEESGDATTETMAGEIRIRIPVVGGRLEKQMAEMSAEGMEEEHEMGVAWLQGDHG
ncbi:MAG: DUF2505 domain-containing protein [Marmoricola sp.]